MNVKSTTYTMKKIMTNVLVVIVMLAAFNVSAFAMTADDYNPVGKDCLRKAKYFYEGIGKSVIEDMQADDAHSLVMDVIITPRSTKKQCTIAKQTDGTNGYRLLQDGRDVVFEVNVNGGTHQVTATNTLERGEPVLLSACYKEGNVSITINGNKPVNRFYQIDSERIANIHLAENERNIIDKLSSLANDSIYELSAFRKALRKTLGRKYFKKYSNQIIDLAYQERDIANVYVGKDFSINASQLVVGSNFAGTIERMRLWQPAKLARVKNRFGYPNTALKCRHQKVPVMDSQKIGSLTQQENIKLHSEDCPNIDSAAKKGVDGSSKLTGLKCGSLVKQPFSSVPNCISIVSNHANAGIYWDYLFESEKALTFYSVKSDLVKSLNQEGSKYENIWKDSSYKYSYLRKDKRTKPDSLFSGWKKWKLNGVNYVNINLSNNLDFFLLSNSFFTGKTQDRYLENDLRESNGNNSSGQSFLKSLIKLNGQVDFNTFYVIQNVDLISKRDRVAKAAIKIDDLKMLNRFNDAVLEEMNILPFERFGDFNVSDQCLNHSVLSSSNRLNYVNQELKIKVELHEASLEYIKHENYNSCNINSYVNGSENRPWDDYFSLAKSELNYHNVRSLPSLFKKRAGSSNKSPVWIRDKKQKLIKLNSRLFKGQQELSYFGEIFTNNNRIFTSRNCDVEYLKGTYASSRCVLLKEYEGPPDISNLYMVNLSRNYLKEVDILYGLG